MAFSRSMITQDEVNVRVMEYRTLAQFAIQAIVGSSWALEIKPGVGGLVFI
jgi:hypothetical protein